MTPAPLHQDLRGDLRGSLQCWSSHSLVCVVPRDLAWSCVSPIHGHQPVAAAMASCPQHLPGEMRGPTRREGARVVSSSVWTWSRLCLEQGGI